MKPYRVGKSPIHGWGAFATSFIAKGTLLKMPEPGDEHLTVETDSSSPIFPGFNHSCNCNLASRAPKSDCRLVLRDIQPGEEITVDYQMKEEHKAFCNCEVCSPLNRRAP